jgi:hypothetical protein
LAQVKGTICSVCYAKLGFYNRHHVKQAHIKRFSRLSAALNDGLRRKLFENAFIYLLNRRLMDARTGPATDPKYFRWFDSGDLQSVKHLDIICNIAKGTPGIKHWLPTQEYRIVLEYLRFNDLPPNLTVRLSGVNLNQARPGLERWLEKYPSLVHSAVSSTGKLEGFKSCPAKQQDNKCQDCRACWSRDVKGVVYSEI